MNIQTRPYTILEHQHRAHLERRARMARAAINGQAERRADNTVRVAKELDDEDNVRRREKTPRLYNHHVLTWQRFMAQFSGSPTRYFVYQRCEELGISYKAILSRTRVRSVVHYRQLLMWEVRQRFNLTLPEIGRIFGGRDHTTVIHALRRVQAMIDQGEIQWPQQEGA